MKWIGIFGVILLLSFKNVHGQSAEQIQTPAEVVEHQLIAYNNGDIEAFMAVFHSEISLYEFGVFTPTVIGFEEVKKIYAALFERSPQLNSTVINRSVIGTKVIDYEYITGRNGSNEPLWLVMIYEIKDGKIYKATALRE